MHADLLPEDKSCLLRELARGKPIAMVGDDIGIALGAMGTDVALMGEDMPHLPHIIRAAKTYPLLGIAAPVPEF